jgi:hypothetical protein
MNCTAQTENRIRRIVKTTLQACLVAAFIALVGAVMSQGPDAFHEFIVMVFGAVIAVGGIIILCVLVTLSILWLMGDISICKTKS